MGVLKSWVNVMNLSLLRKWLPKKKELFFRNQTWSRKKVWRTWPNGHLGSAERHLCDGLLMPVLLKSDMERGSAASKPGNLVRVRSPWTPAATPPLLFRHWHTNKIHTAVILLEEVFPPSRQLQMRLHLFHFHFYAKRIVEHDHTNNKLL